MFKPKIVQFKDGSYAIRKRGLFGYRYLYLPNETGKYWESLRSRDFQTCKTKDLDRIVARFISHSDFGTPI